MSKEIANIRRRARDAFDLGLVDRRFLFDVYSATDDGYTLSIPAIDRELTALGA